jgi:hypothetical protein
MIHLLEAKVAREMANRYRALRGDTKRSGKPYLHIICAFANARLQQNNVDKKNNEKDSIQVDSFAYWISQTKLQPL